MLVWRQMAAISKASKNVLSIWVEIGIHSELVSTFIVVSLKKLFMNKTYVTVENKSTVLQQILALN